MATLNTHQKAKLLVSNFIGQPIAVSSPNVTIAPAGVVTPRALSDGFWIEAAAVGEADVTVTYQGSTGTLHVEVVAAPLTVELDAPVPK